MTEYDESEYAKVPSDFPRGVSTGAVPGTQLKILVVQYKVRSTLRGLRLLRCMSVG